jgi:hypothetical protein
VCVCEWCVGVRFSLSHNFPGSPLLSSTFSVGGQGVLLSELLRQLDNLGRLVMLQRSLKNTGSTKSAVVSAFVDSVRSLKDSLVQPVELQSALLKDLLHATVVSKRIDILYELAEVLGSSPIADSSALLRATHGKHQSTPSAITPSTETASSKKQLQSDLTATSKSKSSNSTGDRITKCVPCLVEFFLLFVFVFQRILVLQWTFSRCR